MSPSFNYLKKHAFEGCKIASIGCAGGLWEIMLGFELNGISIHLQDINKSALNELEINNTISYFEKQYNKRSNSIFQYTLGTETDTNLAKLYFDFVLINNSLHEFSNQKIMLQECRKILKPTGILIIEEQIAKYKGEPHEGCGKSLFKKEELVQLVTNKGFLVEQYLEENNKTMTFILT